MVSKAAGDGSAQDEYRLPSVSTRTPQIRQPPARPGHVDLCALGKFAVECSVLSTEHSFYNRDSLVANFLSNFNVQNPVYDR